MYSTGSLQHARNPAIRPHSSEGEEIYRPNLSSRYSRGQGAGCARLGAGRRRAPDPFSYPAVDVNTKFPLSFTPEIDTADGALEIAGTGSGNFHIGTVSLMPADNVQGFRPDTILLLRELHGGMWRLPGGNFISDLRGTTLLAISTSAHRTSIMPGMPCSRTTSAMDEFMTLCKLIDVEPYITVNAGFGDAHSAAEEVEYINGSAKTHMGALRAQNRHPEPYHVKFWNIGNEPYGSWQLGHTYLKYYVLKHNEFAKAMRTLDPSITLLASGAMPDEMTVEGQARALHLDPQANSARKPIGRAAFLRTAGEILTGSLSTGTPGRASASITSMQKAFRRMRLTRPGM